MECQLFGNIFMEAELQAFTKETPGEIQAVSRVEKIAEQANKATITSMVDYEKGTSLLFLIKQTAAAFEAERKSLTTPIRLVVEGLNARFKKHTEPLEKAEAILKAKMIGFKQAEDRRLAAEAEAERARLQKIADEEHQVKMEAARKEAEEKHQQHLKDLEKEAERLKAEGKSEEAIAIAVEPPLPPVEIAPPPVVQVQTKTLAPTRGTSGGKVSTRTIWKWKLIDITQLDDHYKIPHEIRINAMVGSGVREIKGLEIYSEENMSVGK